MSFQAKQYNFTNGVITVLVNGIPYTVDTSHQNYSGLFESFRKNNSDLFVKLFTNVTTQEKVLLKKMVENTGIVVDGDKVTFNGKEVHNTLCTRIVKMLKAGFDINPMIKFLENLLQNPSNRAITELYDFLENKNLPITEDGCFLAYKSVNSDWYSKSSGNLTLLQGISKNGYIYNAVGETIECVRSDVDDDRSRECSHGLHAGGLRYSGPGGTYNSCGNKVVIVKINPKDAVSVPQDYNAQKVRICKYEVIEEYKEPLNSYSTGIAQKTEEKYTVDDIEEYNEIKFSYTNKNGETKKRHLLVDDVSDAYVFGYLGTDDPSYSYGNETRKFYKDKIVDVVLLDFDYEDDCDDCE